MTTAKDVMLDLETLGTRAGCGVLSIGACTFDMKSKFYARISPEDSRKFLKEDTDTLRWWSKQSSQMRNEAFGGTEDLLTVLNKFKDWFRSLEDNYKNTLIWGNGADFDLPILGAAYDVFDIEVPWHTYNGRCYRTLKNLLPHVKAPPRASSLHHALEDAIYQAEHATILLQML